MQARVVSLPSTYSHYATLRDEHGMNYTVHATELPEDAEIGEKMAYYVDIFDHRQGSATTLRQETQFPYED